jgi:hypothetical protein
MSWQLYIDDLRHGFHVTSKASDGSVERIDPKRLKWDSAHGVFLLSEVEHQKLATFFRLCGSDPRQARHRSIVPRSSLGSGVVKANQVV